MRSLGVIGLLVVLSALTACTSATVEADDLDSIPTVTPSPFTRGPLVTLPDSPVETSTPEPTVITVTLYGTDAAFTWSTGTNLHQKNPSDGPFTYTISYNPFKKTLINASVVSMTNKDAGCKAMLGDTVIVDNTAPGQTLASCVQSY